MKVTTYYADSPLTQALSEEFGPRFEKIDKGDKLLMIAAIATSIAFNESYEVVIGFLDPGGACDKAVTEAIEVILEESEEIKTGLLVALSEQINRRQYAEAYQRGK